MNLEPIIKRITPTENEHGEEQKLVETVFQMLKQYPVKPLLVGSIAKNTDLAGNKDLDIFIQFPEETTRIELEKQGLKIGKDIFAKLGVAYEIDYAEHPYVKGTYKEHLIEIVPCYMGDKIMSAVDRTPFHMEYVRKKLKGNRLNDEIRLLKQFMRGIRVYGAEAKVEGFSGYLVELLTINYGSFVKTLEAARTWRIPQVIDIENLWEDPSSLPKFFTNSNLIVVDPVDKNRNVAAAVSPECLSTLIVKSHEFILQPSEEYFFPTPKKRRKTAELKKAMKARESKLIAIVFKHGKINANTLYAQLRKTAKHITTEATDQEFKVFRHTIWTNESDTSALLFEFEVWKLPELVHRAGPPVDQDPVNQERFNHKYRNDKPYVKDGRWVVDTRRKYTSATDFLPDIVAEKKGFGKNLRELKNADIFVDEEILGISDESWIAHLNEFLD